LLLAREVHAIDYRAPNELRTEPVPKTFTQSGRKEANSGVGTSSFARTGRRLFRSHTTPPPRVQRSTAANEEHPGRTSVARERASARMRRDGRRARARHGLLRAPPHTFAHTRAFSPEDTPWATAGLWFSRRPRKRRSSLPRVTRAWSASHCCIHGMACAEKAAFALLRYDGRLLFTCRGCR